MVWATVTTVLSDPPSGTHPLVSFFLYTGQISSYSIWKVALWSRMRFQHCSSALSLSEIIILTTWFSYQNTTLKFSAVLAGNVAHLICPALSKHEVWQALGDLTSGWTPWLWTCCGKKCIRLRFWLAISPVLALQSQLETDNNELKT